MTTPPSFSSFPPTFGSFPDIEAGPSKPKPSLTEEHKTKSRKGHKDKHDRDRRKEGVEYDDHRRKKDSKKYRKDKDVFPEGKDTRRADFSVESTAELASRSFYSDRKGDVMNVTYGGLHTGDVPRYNMVSKGRRVLGLGDTYIVVHRSHRGVEIDVGRRKHRLTDPKSRRLLLATPRRRLVACPEKAYKYEEIDGFLPLPNKKSSKKDIEEYRDIATAHSPDSDSSDSSGEEDASSSDEDSDSLPLDARQATLKDLEERLASDPTSIPTWLDLLTSTLSTIPLQSKNAPKARAEISLSILSRAVAADSDNKNSTTLRLRILSIGEELWSSDKLYEQWEDALKTSISELWTQWLDWRIRASRNGIEGLIADTQRVYHALGSDEVSKLRVLWRVAVAFQDAGYVERAMALLQAQAELTFKRPEALDRATFGDVLNRLESFWESEVPRVGEPNATGWAAWEANGCPDAVPIPSRAASRSTVIEDPYVRWAAEELQVDYSSRMPLRSFDDEAANDPHSTILFSDIRPVLVNLTHVGSRQAFRLMWISFLGLHIPGFSATLSSESDCPSDDRWSAAHLTTSHLLDKLFPEESASNRITADSHSGVLVGRERLYTHAFGPIKQWSFDVLGGVDAVAGGRCRLWSSEDVRAVDASHIREVFQQCRLSDRDAEWDSLRIAFEGAVDPKRASKVSKGLVSKAQDSLYHWRAHAYLERLRGRLDDARKVYRTVLSATNVDAPALGLLWWDWAEMEWLAGASDAALQVALRSTGTSGSGSVVILRSKRELDGIHQGISDERWKEREAWINLRALLELLTSPPSTAIGIFDSASSKLSPGTEMHESLTVMSLSMLYAFGTHLRNPLPPGIMRERAEYAIRLYPNNTIILAFFLEAEQGRGVWGQVKHVLGDKDPGEKDVLQTIAEIWAIGWERRSWKAEEERIRSRLSMAIQNDRTRGSSVLWRVYLDFEIRTGHLKQAKLLLFRAIKECPMVKTLYLSAFGELRALFTPRELNELGDTMAERGIRMRRALDEAVEGWVDPTSSRLPRPVPEGDIDGGEEELEHDARELRRLMPY
ncbi:hypothetical protein PHLGIDRAFT_97829 [Phlebiopsis gigantea 11061_1 CR5-6]|uniref:DUF1740-domain-containing protein n=1 Tax=Phlebiopsis gigantea (strain 11061_1 CR5-6) TaxID=745531 RepID=A0A0C3PWR5_PHLG1|nr:hypothetical protein PHLGIDRAFT_97829 [Phlebiopsis gigantea 11061_1 CR5-6]